MKNIKPSLKQTKRLIKRIQC